MSGAKSRKWVHQKPTNQPTFVLTWCTIDLSTRKNCLCQIMEKPDEDPDIDVEVEEENVNFHPDQLVNETPNSVIITYTSGIPIIAHTLFQQIRNTD